MESTARRLYFALALLVFLVGLPIVYGWASGLRLGSGFHVVPTGALVVDSTPSGAQVLVDERLLPGRTPLRATALPPGHYTVRVVKAGFQPWSKELSVEGGRATLALSVPLFRSNPAVTRLGPAPDQWSLNPNGSFLLSVRQQELSLQNLSNAVSEDLGPTPGWDEIVWSADGRRALLRYGSSLELVTEGVPSKVMPLQLSSTHAIFDPKDTDAVLLITEQGIEQLGTVSLVHTLLVRGTILDLAASDSHLVWIDDGGRLHQADRSAAGRIIQERVSGTVAPSTKLLTAGDRMFVTNGDGLDLLTATSVVHLLSNGPYAVISDPSKTRLLAESQDELWVLDFSTGQPSLIFRGSMHGPVAWLTPPPIILTSVSGIVATELDDRGSRNEFHIFQDPRAVLVGADVQGRLVVVVPAQSKNPGGLLRLNVR